MLKILTFSITISFAFLFLNNCSFDNHDPYLGDISKCLEKDKYEFASKVAALADEPPVEAERFAVLTLSGDKTHIHLDEISLSCSSNLKIKTSYDSDTLKVKEYWEDKGNSFNSSCSCISSFDLTLESRYDNVKYLVYTYESGRNQIFPVIYE